MVYFASVAFLPGPDLTVMEPSLFLPWAASTLTTPSALATVFFLGACLTSTLVALPSCWETMILSPAFRSLRATLGAFCPFLSLPAWTIGVVAVMAILVSLAFLPVPVLTMRVPSLFLPWVISTLAMVTALPAAAFFLGAALTSSLATAPRWPEIM